MNILDKFLNTIRLNDDFDDDDEFFDDDELDEEEEKPKRRFFKKLDEEEEEEEENHSEKKSKDYSSKTVNNVKTEKAQSSFSSKVTPMRNPKKQTSISNMEVCVIRPTSMEETREIADILLDHCTVVLNLEGIDVELAQRIIDFSSGACYALNGKLQKISSYIFILTPENVEISGDFQEILSGSFNVPPYVRKGF